MKAAIMGFGTVGSDVYEILDRSRETARKKAGEPLGAKYILSRREQFGQLGGLRRAIRIQVEEERQWSI